MPHYASSPEGALSILHSSSSDISLSSVGLTDVSREYSVRKDFIVTYTSHINQSNDEKRKSIIIIIISQQRVYYVVLLYNPTTLEHSHRSWINVPFFMSFSVDEGKLGCRGSWSGWGVGGGGDVTAALLNVCNTSEAIVLTVSTLVRRLSVSTITASPCLSFHMFIYLFILVGSVNSKQLCLETIRPKLEA